MTAHDILLLMTSLSQVTNPEQLKRLFLEAINEMITPAKLRYTSSTPEKSPNFSVKLKTLKENYDTVYITADDSLRSPDKKILQTACQLLAVLLENLAQRERLKSHRDLIWQMSADPILVADPKSGILIDMNRAAEKLMGRSHDEMVGASFETLHPTEDKERMREIFIEAVETGISRGRRGHIVRKDKSLVPIEINALLAEVDDQEVVIGVFRDITERKEMQARERELQTKLIDAERRESLGILAGGVAHDLNNILGPIVILPELIEEMLDDGQAEDIEEAKEHLAVMKNSAKRAASVIMDLKALGKRDIAPSNPIDANKLIRDFLKTRDVESLRLKFSRVKIGSILPQKELSIGVDSTSMHRILLNLVINSAEAISNKGKIQIGAKHTTLTKEFLGYEVIPPGNYVTVKVSDTGNGISEEQLKSIFDPFVTYKKESSGGSGSGLGLSVVHSMIKDHQGYIDIELGSRKWSTTFSIYFPAMADVQPDDNELREEPVPTGHGDILIVDDEPTQRFVAKRALKRLGYTVTEAINGKEAVKLFKNSGKTKNYDLVLLDMIMEKGFDGLDTYQAILKHVPQQKVIIISGHAEDKRAAAAQSLGAHWLAKPYEIRELAKALAAIIVKNGLLDNS